MDQTPPFQPSFNMEFFSSLHLPHGMGLGDSHDHPKHKASFAELESPLIKFKNPMHTDHHADNSFLDHASFFLPQQDDMFHEPFANFKGDSHLKNWQPPQNPTGFLDVSLDPWFAKNNDMDPFQMCRSRGGSFNFGRLRRDSEDLFHMNSDFFRHIRNITDAKTPFENNFMKKSFHMQDGFEMPIDDAHAMQIQIPQSIPTNQVPFAGNIPASLQGTAMTVSAQNSDSTDDTTGADSSKKKGRKKRMLNDKSEFVDEDSNAKPVAKAGRPKKAKDEESVQPKLQKAKSMKKGAKMNDMDGETYVKQEKVDDKSTEISSSSASKIEDSPHGIKPNTDIMSEIMKLKAPENLKEILGGMNVPNEVKEFFQKTTWMGQGGVNPETRKIGTLTLAERKVKIEKYLQKRKKRTWSRKINYDCRKRVADSRLRIKGRFVTRDQAFTLMEEANISFNPETITNAEIKTLLTEKFGGSVLKKKSSDKQDTTICLKRPNEKELDEYELEDNDDFGSALSE